jgi:class 3 adenylate cyclase
MIRNIYRLDVRDVLPLIRVPTLVIQHPEARGLSAGHGRYLAAHIPGARRVELPGPDNLIWAGDQEAVVAEIEEFVTGARPAQRTDRRLATVLFTDIVDSTKKAAELGDARWKGLLHAHDELVRTELARFRGVEVKTTGDGFLAAFDGPARAVGCARAIADGVRDLGIEIRAGCHTGEVELLDGDLGGIAVHIGARVAALAGAGEVLVSSTVKDLVVGSGLTFEDRGQHSLKGVPDAWRLYAVT